MLVSLMLQSWMLDNPLEELLTALKKRKINYIVTANILHLSINKNPIKVPLRNLTTGVHYDPTHSPRRL